MSVQSLRSNNVLFIENKQDSVTVNVYFKFSKQDLIQPSIKKTFRSIKNGVKHYDDGQKLVRSLTADTDHIPKQYKIDALNNYLCGNYKDPQKALDMLWKRLTDYRCLRHVEKSLLIIEQLIQKSCIILINYCKEKKNEFIKLQHFIFKVDGSDIGQNVRRRSKNVHNILINGNNNCNNNNDNVTINKKKSLYQQYFENESNSIDINTINTKSKSKPKPKSKSKSKSNKKKKNKKKKKKIKKDKPIANDDQKVNANDISDLNSNNSNKQADLLSFDQLSGVNDAFDDLNGMKYSSNGNNHSNNNNVNGDPYDALNGLFNAPNNNTQAMNTVYVDDIFGDDQFDPLKM